MKRWQRKDLGYVCEPYRIGPFVLPDLGALCTVWRAWHERELIGEYADEYEAMAAAREHANRGANGLNSPAGGIIASPGE